MPEGFSEDADVTWAEEKHRRIYVMTPQGNIYKYVPAYDQNGRAIIANRKSRYYFIKNIPRKRHHCPPTYLDPPKPRVRI